MARGAVLLVAVTACGRVGFDPNAAPADADVPPTAACAARLFCDDFEQPDLGAWHGDQQSGGATIERVSGFGRTGASLRTAGPVGTTVAAKYVDVFAATGPDAWVRLHLYAASGTVLDVEAVTLADPARANELVFAIYDDVVDLHAHGLAGDFEVRLLEPPPRDRWVCWEVHVVFGLLGSVALYRDGVHVLGKASVDTRPPAGDLSRLLVGLTSKPPTLAQELFVDDVAADVTRIGCE